MRQALHVYDAIQKTILDYDQEILRKLAEMTPEERRGGPAPPVQNRQGKTIRKRGQEPMRQALCRMSGVDMTPIDSIGPRYSPPPER